MDKLVFILMSMFMISKPGLCQQRTVERNFKVGKNEKVKMHLKFGNTITVKSWDKNEVAFRASIEINQGTLNDALELHFNHKNGRLQITSNFDKEKLQNSHVQDCKGKDYLKYNMSGESGDYAICQNISYTIILPKTATLAVQSINADISLVNLSGPIRAKSISGFVDLSRPANIPSSVKLKTISGKIFTDMNITDDKKNRDKLGGFPPHIFKGAIKGGGDKLQLESISGNIYLRKVK